MAGPPGPAFPHRAEARPQSLGPRRLLQRRRRQYGRMALRRAGRGQVRRCLPMLRPSRRKDQPCRLGRKNLHQPGRKMKTLFQQCREEKAEAGGELAAQLRALIEEERESVREEQRLWEEHCELARDLPLDDDDPALQPLSGNWQEAIDHEAQFDRQINAKMRLLIRLKTPPRQKKTESGPASGAEDGGTGRIGLDSGIPVASAAGTGCADLSRKSALPPVTESHAENIKTGVTKPSNLLESIKPRYGVPSPQAQLRPPALGW